MQSPEHIEILDFQHPDERALAAARLILAEVAHVDDPTYIVPDSEIQEYVENTAQLNQTHYAYIDKQSKLVGVARVEYGKQHATSVDVIATERDERQKGYGRKLMLHIAREAADRHDTRIGVMAFEPDFFARLGFTRPSEQSIYMFARPEDVK